MSEHKRKYKSSHELSAGIRESGEGAAVTLTSNSNPPIATTTAPTLLTRLSTRIWNVTLEICHSTTRAEEIGVQHEGLVWNWC